MSGRNSLKERSARLRSRYLYNTQQTQKTNIHVLRGMRNRDPSNQAADTDALDKTKIMD